MSPQAESRIRPSSGLSRANASVVIGVLMVSLAGSFYNREDL